MQVCVNVLWRELRTQVYIFISQTFQSFPLFYKMMYKQENVSELIIIMKYVGIQWL